jgi:hypothetical protein
MDTQVQLEPKLRRTGIGAVGDVPWGTHFFLFYEAKEDLIETLVPYFRAGLEDGEFCLWVVPEPLTQEEALSALRRSIPGFDRYRRKNNMELVQGREWYLNDNQLDVAMVAQKWSDKLHYALSHGYSGLRLAGSTAWLAKKDWKEFSEYEKEVNDHITDSAMTALCTYPLHGSAAAEILDVTRTHQFAIARRQGGWEVIETSELKQAKAEIKKLNDELEERVVQRTAQLLAVNEELTAEIERRRRAEEERKNAEDALRASERELNRIVETMPVLVWCASPEGDLTYINHRISEYIGVPFDKLAKSGWLGFIHPHDVEYVVQAWSHSVATSELFEVQCRLRRADGVYRWMHSVCQLGRDSEGLTTRWYGLFIDIDERKNMEESLRVIQGRLARAAQAAAIGELSASIAHEINQPLTAVIINGHACLRWLSAQPPDLTNAYEAAERIVRNGQTAGEVVQHVRALFKEREVERAPLNVNEVIGEVLRLQKDELKKGRVKVETNCAKDLPYVEADRVQLQQLILNLLLNGIEAMDSITDRPKRLFISSKQQNADTLLVEITDSGPGLKDPERIFDSFYTTKPNGLGMGLAICRSIVESHSGRLWATSREGPGATFCFTLPAQARTGA